MGANSLSFEVGRCHEVLRAEGNYFYPAQDAGIPRNSSSKEVKKMSFGKGSLEEFDALYDMGRSLVERQQVHGVAVESEFDTCSFDQWRRKAIDLLFSHGGCDDLYYQRFSQEVVSPDIRSLEKGMRIIAAARDDVESAKFRSAEGASAKKPGFRRPSVSYH